MVIVGLAPAAHGANRTGRMFTGDRSGTCSTPRCTSSAWHHSRPRSRPVTACGCAECGSLLRSGARHRRTGPPLPSGTPAGRGWRASCNCCGRRCARWWCWAASAGRRCCRCWRLRPGGCPGPAGVRPRRHGAVAGPRLRTGAEAVRLLPRQPAEHLHRTADTGHAARGAGCRGGGRRVAARGPAAAPAGECPPGDRGPAGARPGSPRAGPVPTPAPGAGLPLAVVYKFIDDQGNVLAALITY